MKHFLVALFALLFTVGSAYAQYPGAGYGGPDYFLADVFTNGLTTSYRTGTVTSTTPVVVLQNTPTITTPNFTTSFAVDSVTFGQHATNYNEILDRTGALSALQVGNLSDPTNYYNNTTHQFRTRGLTTVATLTTSGLALFSPASGRITLAIPAATAATNTLTFPAGTTDFSSTGGTSQVVKQTSSGGAFTVARLACSDLSDSGTGCAGSSAIVVGTTVVSSGTNTRILYDNSGVVGEYTLTGSGTVVAMQTAPTFVTSITAPLVVGGSGTTGTQLTFKTTTGTGTTDAFAWVGGTNGGTTFATLQTGSFNIQTGSSYNINSTSVLNATTLGSGVTASSLTSLGTITSLTATTINAFTLGGTIAGGGNQINNVIIGTSTPLAGSFTTLSASSTNPSLTLSSNSVPAIVFGTSGNTGGYLISQGSGGFNFLGAGGANLLQVVPNAASLIVNFPRIVANIAGASPFFDVQGSDTDIGFSFLAKGAGSISFITAGGSAQQFAIIHTASSTRNITVTGSNGGNPTINTSAGSLAITPAVVMASTLTISGIGSDATHTDATVCVDTTSKLLLQGSGTLGICLGTSSARYKRAIIPLNEGLVAVGLLAPKNFYYKKGFGDDGAREQYGFLAEDVVKIIPRLVGLDKDGKPNSVDILGMVPIMVKAMQQLKADNDNLRSRIDRLEKRVAR